MRRPTSRTIGIALVVVLLLGGVAASCSDSDSGSPSTSTSTSGSNSKSTIDVKVLETYLNGTNSSDPNPVVSAKCPNKGGRVGLNSTITCEVTLKDGTAAKRKVVIDPQGGIMITAA